MVNWTSDVDAKLFACVIKQVTTLNLQKLATDMAAQNIECTPKAISHRIHKLKTTGPGGSPAKSQRSAPATPARARAATNKRAASGTPKSTKGGGAKNKKPSSIKKEDDDLDSVTSASSDNEVDDNDPDADYGSRSGARKRIKREDSIPAAVLAAAAGGPRVTMRARSRTVGYKEESTDDEEEEEVDGGGVQLDEGEGVDEEAAALALFHAAAQAQMREQEEI